MVTNLLNRVTKENKKVVGAFNYNSTVYLVLEDGEGGLSVIDAYNVKLQPVYYILKQEID